MRIKLSFPDCDHRIVSLAKDGFTAADLTENSLSFILIENGQATLFPDNTSVAVSEDNLNKICSCDNYDVFELFPDGILRQVCDCDSTENVFYVTGVCNSNCVMCPSPVSSRINCPKPDVDLLIEIAKHMPSDLPHITVTGGEPFMAGKEIFRLFEYCKDKFEDTEFQILTNGRIFAIEEYCDLLWETVPYRSILGIPLHASTAALHDSITQAPGSFHQTTTGLRHLLDRGCRVEIRIVVSRLNAEDLEDTALLIADRFSEAAHVTIMAMEMTGNAFVNGEQVWIEYREAFTYVKRAIHVLIRNGIDVALYNYPLCTVEPEFRTLCAKSISPEKVRFSDECTGCSVKDACGGLFAGSYRWEASSLKRI